MNSFRRWYTRTAEGLASGGDFKADWKWLLPAAVLVYAVNFGIRLLDWPKWDHPALWVGGERIMSTHDAYAWLAGVKGVGDYLAYPFTAFTGFLAQVTGASLGQVGFWTTGIVSSLVGVVILLWGWLLGGRTAGVLAGMIGGLAPGFYFRSRLGYHDTDMFTLLVPLFAAWALALLARPHLRPCWAPGQDEKAAGADAGTWLDATEAWLAFGLGVLVNFAQRIHQDVVRVDKIMFWVALAGSLLVTRRGGRSRLAKLLCVFATAAFLGYYQAGVPLDDWFRLILSSSMDWERGTLVTALRWVRDILVYAAPVFAAASAWAFSRRAGAVSTFFRRPWPVLTVLVTILVLGNLIPAPSPGELTKIFGYLKPVAETQGNATGSAVQPPVFPAIAQSIREARNLPWEETLGRLAPASWLAALGVAGFAVVLALRPAAGLLLPLLGAALAGLWLGVRFTMFGGPVVALGLGVCLDWVAGRLFAGRTWRTAALLGVQLALGLALVWPYYSLYRLLPPTPMLSKLHAEALIRLKAVAPPNSQVWTWWDYGYATQYFAQRVTPSDGGRHSGRDIYPTALALATSSPRFANQLIRYSAAQGNNPGAVWAGMSAAEVRALLQTLKTEDVQQPRTAPQYVVVAWDDVPLTGWISFYGTWDVVSGQGTRARVEVVEAPFRFEPMQGAMVFRDGGPRPVRSIDIVGRQGRKSQTYAGNLGPRLVVNADLNVPVLMDDAVYSSMLVRLLIADPADPEIARYFRLVVDLGPHARIYEVP
jgi:dolichyl-diphosphooligosaccharide--protein glycosyltransferase